MSSDKMQLELDFEVKATGVNDLNTAQQIIDRITRSLDALVAKSKAAANSLSSLSGKGKLANGTADNAGMKQALGIDRDRLKVLKMQMTYRRAEQNDAIKAAARAEKAQAREFRQRMAFGSAMARQRIADERAVAREIERTDRARAASTRRQESDRRRAQRDASTRLNDAGRHGREAYRSVSRAPAAAAAVAGAGAGAVARKALRSEVDTDSAEIDARIYGNLSKNAARDLREKWAEPLSEALGVSTAKLLTSYVDAIKLGIPTQGAKAFTELNTKVSEAWSVPFETVTDTLGTINTLLTSKGEAFDIGRLKSVANTMQVLAAGQSTTPEKLISFLQRGAGAAQVLGMSQEAGLAFGSASTSLGNQAGQSGRLFDYMASRLIELPNLTKKHGDEGRNARSLISELGYGSADAMNAKRRADPDSFLPDFMDRFNKIKDPKKKEQAIRFFAGREWMGEMGRMVQGADTYREAVKLQKEAKTRDAIEETWQLHLQKLKTIIARIRSGALNLLNEIGKAFGPILSDFSTYFLQWSRKLSGGAITDRVKAVFQGFTEGLGYKSIPEMLEGIFGKPGQGSVGSVEAFKATAKAFTEGFRDIVDAVRGLIGAFSGGDSTVIARWTGRIVALSMALTVLSPVLAVLGGLVGILKAAAALRGLAGLGGAAGAGAAGAAGAASAIWSTAGKLIGVAFLAEIAQAFNVLKPDANKGVMGNILEELVPAPLRRYLDTGSFSTTPPAKDPSKETPVDRLKAEGERHTEILEEIARLEREALQLQKTKDLADKAKKPAGSSAPYLDSVHNARQTALSGSIGGGAGDGSSPSTSGGGATPGGAGTPGSSGVPAIPDSVPMTAQEKNQLGLILQHESGGRNVMNGVGAKMGVSPTAAKGYTAQGYYQILNSNWRRIAPKLGINTPNAMASTFEEQTRVAHHLLRNGGIQNWSNYNPKLRAALARGDQAQFAPAGGSADGGTGAAPGGGGGGSTGTGGSPVAGAGQSTGHIDGQIQFEGQTYDFGSGGHRGANSIPFGTHKITPGTIGPWGQSHGALGIAGNAIWDKTLGRMRTGIEFHAASSASKLSAGCIAIAKGQYARFRAHVLDYVKRNGEAYLTVGADGRATITSARESVATQKAQDSVADTQAAANAARGGATDSETGLGARLQGKVGQGSNDREKALGNLDLTPPRQNPAANAPLRNEAQRMMGGGGRGAGGGGGDTTIHINGYNKSPQELASAVQRANRQQMDSRVGDIDSAWS